MSGGTDRRDAVQPPVEGTPAPAPGGDDTFPGMPSTRPGCLSLAAFALFCVFLLLFFAGVAVGQKGGDTFFSNPYLALTILAAGTCGVSAGLLALFAVIAMHERGCLVWPIMVIGLLVGIFALGEAGGHDKPGDARRTPTPEVTLSPAAGSPAPSATATPRPRPGHLRRQPQSTTPPRSATSPAARSPRSPRPTSPSSALACRGCNPASPASHAYSNGCRGRSAPSQTAAPPSAAPM